MYDSNLARSILLALEAAFPAKRHLHELRAASPEYEGKPLNEWLSAIQALRLDGKVNGKFLAEGTFIADAAALYITEEGRQELRQASRDSKIEVDGAARTEVASRVFVSYSWDSEEHKKWVHSLAARLRADGLDAIIDETHLSLGARSPEFMERSVRESACVLVICTAAYKRRFDNRTGGAGYEGHIITGEIIGEVGNNKFIPVLRSGDWKSAVPTALSGVHGVDLSKDSPDVYRKLVTRLHGVSAVPPVGPRPDWLDRPTSLTATPVSTQSAGQPDLREFWAQRRLLGETEILLRIWSKPRWRIWICPTVFRKARFQDLNQCREFMLSSAVRFCGPFPFPCVSAERIETSYECIAGEVETSEVGVSHAERWVLFRSGQFVQNGALDEVPQLGRRIHVLEILDTTTAVFEFAARLARRGVLSPGALISFELQGIDGRALTWPKDVLNRDDALDQRAGAKTIASALAGWWRLMTSKHSEAILPSTSLGKSTQASGGPIHQAPSWPPLKAKDSEPCDLNGKNAGRSR